MTAKTKLALAPLLLTLLVAGGAMAGAEQELTAQDVCHMMIEAHGGMEKWASAPTVSLQHELTSPQDPDDVWRSIEVTEQGSRRSYQEWPLEEARIASDGKETWSLNWKRKNPPKFMVNLAYYFLNLPWITQDNGVNLNYEGLGRFPTAEKDYWKVRMTFDAGVGESPDDYYTIFVDPESHRMAATEFVVTYGAMLDLFQVPEEVTAIGPLYHVYDEFGRFDGLVVPTSYRTFFVNAERLYGNHTVSHISFTQSFDASRLQRPKGAIVDQSSNQRATQKKKQS